MALAFIRLGDSTSHGGTVTEASMGMRSEDGRGFARVGDAVTCPIKGHGTNAIATGDPTFILDNRPVARHGDKTQCGATLIASQSVTTVSSESDEAASQAENQATMAASSNELAETWADADSDEPRAMRFQAIDPDTGQPTPKCVYILTREDGTQHGGITDREGFTEIIETRRPEQIAVHFIFKSPKGDNLEHEDLL